MHELVNVVTDHVDARYKHEDYSGHVEAQSRREKSSMNKTAYTRRG